jgi:hypothetical protein
MNKTMIMLGLLTVLALLPLSFNACMVNGQWVNCTIVTNTTPMTNIVNTMKVNDPWTFYFMYITLYIGVAMLLMVQDRSFARFNYITFIGILLAVVFYQYTLVDSSVVVLSISLFCASLVGSLFFNNNR